MWLVVFFDLIMSHLPPAATYNPVRICPACTEPKLAVDFYREGPKKYFSSYCKVCTVKRTKKYQTANPEKYTHYIRKGRYGISKERFEAMSLAQNNLCIICNQPERFVNGVQRNLSVDHDHNCCPGPKSCGKCIRGLTCDRCNGILGRVKDDSNLLLALALYLERFKMEFSSVELRKDLSNA